MSALNKAPLFKHQASFASTLNIGYPTDNTVCWPQERDGSEVAQAPSGVEDAWYVGTDHYMECDIRWVPELATTNPVADGFSVSGKWEAMLAWAKQRGLIRYQPDKNAAGTFVDGYLIDYSVTPEADGSNRYHLKFRSTSSYAVARAAV